MKNYLTIICTLVLCANLSAQTSSDFPGKLYRINNVEISSLDGFPLQATMYRSSTRSSGVLLLHVMGVGQRFDYEKLATQLAVQGFNVLSLDLRGHGESGYLEDYEYTNETVAGDIEAALSFLKAQSNVNAEQVCVIGASGTVAEAVALASKHPEVTAVAGLSGHADEAGQSFIEKANHMAFLGIGAETDSLMTKVDGAWQLSTSAKTMKDLVERSKHPQSELILYREAPHGTAMLDTKKDLIPRLTSWLTEVLSVEESN